jgi:putative DNA primase/helicase
MSSLLDAALEYAARGWAVFPLEPGQKRPLGRLAPHGCRSATTDEQTIRGWWEDTRNANVGIATGDASGLAVVDVDGDQGARTWEVLLVGRDITAPTLTSRTPRGGYHLVYRRPDDGFRNSANGLGEMVDTRGDGGYIVAPPSIANGKVYRWDDAGAVVAPLPEWILEAMAPPDVEYDRGTPVSDDMNDRERRRAAAWAKGTLRDRVERMSGCAEGGRNARLYASAIDVGKCVGAGVLDYADAAQQLHAAAAAAGLVDKEIRGTIKSGMSRGMKDPLELPEDDRPDRTPPAYDAPRADPREHLHVVPPPDDGDEPPCEAKPHWYNLTDVGNADRFRDDHRDGLRFCSDIGGWHRWTGQRWEMDRMGRVVEMAKGTIAGIGVDGIDGFDDKTVDALIKHANRSEGANRLFSMLRLAESSPPLPVRTEDWDRNHWLLSVKNGTVDLRTGKLRQATQDDLITKSAAVEYDEQAECPRFLKFMEEVMLKRWDLVDYIQRAIGYSLTGSTREQCLFFLHGEGSNGKSTLMNTIRDILGDDYSQSIEPALLLDRNKFGGGPTPEIARLRGARLVTTSEPNPGKRLDEAFIKGITGGDPLTARFNRQDTFQFTPVLKLWFSANHKPRIVGTDHAIWRRIKLVPFEAKFEGDQIDPDLEEKLRAEWPGILRWAVEGCVLWQSSGIKEPEEVKMATAEYRGSQDILAPFIEECCIVEGDCDCTVGELYDAYRKWAENSGEKPYSKKKLGMMLDERGFSKVKVSGGIRVRKGIKLRGVETQAGMGYGGDRD